MTVPASYGESSGLWGRTSRYQKILLPRGSGQQDPRYRRNHQNVLGGDDDDAGNLRDDEAKQVVESSWPILRAYTLRDVANKHARGDG